LNNIDSKSKNLKSLRKEYDALTGQNKNLFEKLAKLEEVIMQIRAKESIMTGPSDVKLSLVREYLYARYPFYRKGMLTKDIRVIVDKSEFWGDNLNVLLKNKEFMSKATDKLSKAMDEEINSNLHEYNNLI
jgi:hypothetical protein